MPLIRKSKTLNALVFALLLLTGVLLGSQIEVPPTKAETQPTLQDIRNSAKDSQDDSIDFAKNASVPDDIKNMKNDTLDKAIKKAKFEYGVVPNDRNKTRFDALKKERWARLIQIQMTTGSTATSLTNEGVDNGDDSIDPSMKPSSFKSDGLQNNFLSDSDAFGMCDEDTSDYCNLQTQKDFTLGGGSEMDLVKEEQKQQFQENLAEQNAFGNGIVGTTNASFNANCATIGGSTINMLVNGSPFCFSAGVPGAGAANFSCNPGSTVTISAVCTGPGTCSAFANVATNLSCPFAIPGFLGGSFGGAGGFGAGVASINCTCQ